MGRRLGQHFLNDPAILDRIVAAIDPQPDDAVVEIGSGKGSLTRRLAGRVRTVVTIEKDPVLAGALREAELPANVRVVNADALEVEWGSMASEPAISPVRSPLPPSRFPESPRGFKLIGNLPYYITAPLLQKATSPPVPSVAVFLVQREVGDRLAAGPGTKAYGALTVGVQVVARVERLFAVRAGSFTPPPRVTSSVVRLSPLAAPLLGEHERGGFRTFVGALFGQRRKQLIRSLRGVAGRSKEEAAAILAGIGVDPQARPEVLAPSTLVALYRSLAR